MLVKKSNLNIIKPQLPVTNYQFKGNTLDREEPAKHYHEDVIIKNPDYRNSLGHKTQFPQQILCKEKKKGRGGTYISKKTVSTEYSMCPSEKKKPVKMC